jgi:hypothetical protein
LQLSHRLDNLRGLVCRDLVIRRRHAVRGAELFAETGGTEKNKTGTDDQEKSSRESGGAVVIYSKPVHG